MSDEEAVVGNSGGYLHQGKHINAPSTSLRRKKFETALLLRSARPTVDANPSEKPGAFRKRSLNRRNWKAPPGFASVFVSGQKTIRYAVFRKRRDNDNLVTDFPAPTFNSPSIGFDD